MNHTTIRDEATEEEDEDLMEWIARRIVSHPIKAVCDEDECFICAVRDCPEREPLHYHHDGCPACAL